MKRLTLGLIVAAAITAVMPARAAGNLSGDYVEVRSNQVYT